MENFFDLPGSVAQQSAVYGEYEKLIARVEKPSRYLGHEINQVVKDTASVKLRMALAFPDVYEVGMSHLGLKILYDVVNSRPDLYAERVFAPWPDMEAVLRTEQKPLVTLETATALVGMDFVGFSLQYELCATTVLQMLELGGIPLRSENRSVSHPFVVGGGPFAFNPMPLSPFFDAFVIGDGEDVILELAHLQIRWKEKRGSREDLLREWKRLPGVFVPSQHKEGEVVSRRVVADLNRVMFPTKPVVPFCQTVHDRISLEVARGCTRGCRFCQAGMIYRPVRERDPRVVFDLARQSVASTGWEEVALLSLSSGDYSCIVELIKSMILTFGPDQVALSLPSLRTDTFAADMAQQIRTVRKTGFTLAPEAGTARLRRIINKCNTEADLEKAVTAAFEQGWKSVKLYFMIGLPFETYQDLDGMIGLVRQASKWARGGHITVSVSTFVPKSHTPFQWAGQISMIETGRRQQYIRRYFNKGRVRVKFHDPRISLLEGVIARGDTRLAEVIENAFKKGARFDGWDDQLQFNLWMESFEDAGLNPETYLQPRPESERLPWSFIESGIRPAFLLEEWRRAQVEATTQDCRFGDCVGCGVCDFEETRTRLATSCGTDLSQVRGDESAAAAPVVRRFRLRYAKLGPMRFLGHHDVVRVFERAFRRARIRLDHSKGFHPRPRLRFSSPLAVGIESVAEYVDFDLVDSPLTSDQIGEVLRQQLPEGIAPMEVNEISLNAPPLSAKIRAITYEFALLDVLSSDEIQQRVGQFSSVGEFTITKVGKGKTRTRDLKQWVTGLDVSESVLRLTLKADQAGSVHSLDAVEAILGLNRVSTRTMKIVKTSVTYDTSK